MGKELHDHKTPGKGIGDVLVIEAMDEVGSGNAHHEYVLRWQDERPDCECILRFQNGPINEAGVGVNGITNEALIAVVLDRLRGFQTSDYSCPENSHAIIKLMEAMHWLHARTAARIRRGVEGLSQV